MAAPRRSAAAATAADENEKKLSGLVGNFLRTEAGTPQLLDFLTAKLASAIGPEIDGQTSRINNSHYNHHQQQQQQQQQHLAAAAASAHHRHLPKTTRGRGGSPSPSPPPPPSSTKSGLSARPSLNWWTAAADQHNGPSSSSAAAAYPIIPEWKAQKMANDLAKNSTAYREFRTRSLAICSKLVNDLWRMEPFEDGLANDWPSGTFGHNSEFDYHDEDGTNHHYHEEGEEPDSILALSSFSLLDHSMKEMPEEELNSLLGIVIAEQVELAVRRANLQKLLFISPTFFAKSKAFDEIFLGHLHALLPIPELFEDTMHLVSRLLNCHDEWVWAKTSVCLCRVAMNLDRDSKRSLALFFCQILSHGPYIFRSFSAQNIGQCVQSYMELLTAETATGGGGAPTPNGFLATFARVDTRVDWVRPWLHDQRMAPMLVPKLGELIEEIVNGGMDKVPPKLASLPSFWAFQCSLLLHAIRHPPLLQFLRENSAKSAANFDRDFAIRLGTFISRAFSPPPHRRGLAKARKVVSDGLLEASMNANSATFLASNGILSRLLSMASAPDWPSRLHSLPLRLFLNILTFTSSPPPPPLAPLADYLRINFATSRPVEQRQLAAHMLSLLPEKYSTQDLARNMPDFSTLLAIILPQPDPSIPAHRRLIVVPCLLALKNPLQLKLCRKTRGKWLNRLWLRNDRNQRQNLPNQPASWLNFALPIRPIEEERRQGIRHLLQFISPQKAENLAFREEANSSSKAIGQQPHSPPSLKGQCHSQLDFLPSSSSASTASSNEMALSQPIFLLLTQPGLLLDFLNSPELANELQRNFVEFEGPRGGQPAELLQFLTKLDILTTNLDFLAELRRFLPNLASRLVQLLHKFCSNSTGQPVSCEISRQIGTLLGHLVVAAHSERRFYKNLKGIHLEEEEEEDEEGWTAKEHDDNDDIWSNVDWSKIGEEWTKMEVAEEEDGWTVGRKRREGEEAEEDEEEQWKEHGRAFSMGLVEEMGDEQFWLSLLPSESSANSRRALLCAIFSPRWRTKCPLSPFRLIWAFAQKFWPKSENGARPKMQLKPPPHSEWLPLLADYAMALGLRPNKAQMRHQIAGLRMLSTEGVDWFLFALFLASGPSAHSTVDLCERLLHYEHATIGSVWPMASTAATLVPFDDNVTLHVFPRVLHKLSRHAAFRRVLPFLGSVGLPSLLHLLLFYSHRAYLGILPFRAVQEYLLLALLGGPDIQSLHFCAVLAHICQHTDALPCLHSPGRFVRLFLRPEFLDDFSFSRFANLIGERGKEEEEEGQKLEEWEEELQQQKDDQFDEWM